MRRALVAAALVALVAGQPACQRQPHESVAAPVGAVRDFLVAVDDRDCETAWSYFSARTQAYIEEKSREMVEAAPYYADTFAPRRLYCEPTSVHRFGSYAPETARLKSQSGRLATVTVERHEGTDFLLPGFWPTDTKVTIVEMKVAEENGAWKILLP